MTPEWVVTVLLIYMVIDGSIGMYLCHGRRGPYSDGKMRTCSPVPFLTIPTILLCKIFGWDVISKEPEGVHKINWKEYKEIRKEEDVQ